MVDNKGNTKGAIFMARKQNENKPKDSDMSIVKTLLFRDDKDEDLLALVNTYSSMRPAFKPKALIREILLEVLPERITSLQEGRQAIKTA